MIYDPERDPGRSHEGSPPCLSDEPDPVEDAMGAVASVLAWPVLVINGLIEQPMTGGNVSLQDTIAQVTALQRAVQDQSMLINDFLKNNRDTMELVQSQIRGSTKGYDQEMLSALSQTEISLRSSLSNLQQASTALDRVQAI